MLCAISGEAPQVPVASKRSGAVYEKRLIESYIKENGTEPETDEELTADDLVELKSSRIVRPRPPTLTSIPALLSTFQNEWDALALETYTLKQQLVQTRQELSTALYQHDAAVRMIDRLMKERDEARSALSKLSVNGSSAANGEAMQLDGQQLSAGLAAKIDETQASLMKTRRKRPIPEDWATVEDFQTFEAVKLPSPAVTGSRTIAIDGTGDMVIQGGSDGIGQIYSISQQRHVQALQAGSPIMDATWNGNTAILATSKGEIQFFENADRTASFSRHAGAATGVTVHPSGALAASAGEDKSFVLYDIEAAEVAMQVFTDSALTCIAFHPDGHLLGVGGISGQIMLFEVKTGSLAAKLEAGGPLRCLMFSENGTWLATVTATDPYVQIWDLRKQQQIKQLEVGHVVTSIKWDYTGQFLVAAGVNGFSIKHYSKSTKEWSEPMQSSDGAVVAEWGSKALSLIILGSDGRLTAFTSS